MAERVLTAVAAVLDDGAGDGAGMDDGEHWRTLWAAVARVIAPALPEERVAGWFGVTGPVPPPVRALLAAALAAGELTPRAVGLAYDSQVGDRAALRRRDQGVYFTPPAFVEFVVEQTLRPLLDRARTPADLRRLAVCDPAAGAGAFAFPAVVLIAARAAELGDPEPHRTALTQCLHTVDVDPVAVALMRALLAAEFWATEQDMDALESHLIAGDAVLGPPPGPDRLPPPGAVDWDADFPAVFARGGFDAVLGNPPWGTVKPAVREYFADQDTRVRDLQGAALRGHLARAHGAALPAWERESARKRSYSGLLRTSAGYAHQGSGDTEFYRYFIERGHQILNPAGRLGVIVPSALQRAEGAAPLRGLLLDDGTAELMLDFLNSRRVFPIHTMFRFLVLVWQRGRPDGVRRAAFELRDLDQARAVVAGDGHAAFPVGYLRKVSGDRLSVPVLADGETAGLFERLYDRHPPLGEDGGPWNVRFVRELDMTNDSHSFVSVEEARAQGARREEDGTWAHPRLGPLLPLYEGRMVQQFDAAAKRYLGGQGRRAMWEVLRPGEKGVHPHYLVSAEIAERKAIPGPRAGFCDVTGHANERTVLAALIPHASVCGNKVPTCRFDIDDKRLPLLWLALANSFTVDWVVRRRVSTTLNFFQWQQVAFPRVAPDSPEGIELIELANQLCHPVDQAWGPDELARRALLRADIDAITAELFDLTPRDLAVVLSDFPLLDRRGTRAGDTTTRDLVLHRFAERGGHSGLRLSDVGLRAEGADDVATRVAETERIAYIPGELGAELFRSR